LKHLRKGDDPKRWRKKFRLLSPSERDHLKYLELMGKLHEEDADLQRRDVDNGRVVAADGVIG
jgi:hypothetical protein